MTVQEKSSIQKLMQMTFVIQDKSKVDLIKKEFIKDFAVDVTKDPSYIIRLLEMAFGEQNAIDVESALYVGFAFNLFTKDFANVLCKLIEANWHFQHENIASILKQLKCPDTVDSLFKAALLRLKYLEYSDVSPLAVKCIWALGDINTRESRKKLELLAQSENQIIKDNAIMQLSRK
ncbi:hypothetical protein [Lacrimispora sp.]|uniref:hypothetical protein n=1 Tax=Lacrimispora sp. TaxID=2719234 RepID=UPI00289D403A|nr:hypothetical protein [Lacrimispora sp.]